VARSGADLPLRRYRSQLRGLFVRSAAQLDRARAAFKEAGIAFKILDEHFETTNEHVSISTMHLAKGREFRAVVVMACNDEIIPLQEASRQSATTPICKKSTTPSGTCSMLPVPAPEIICWFPESTGIRIFGRLREGRSRSRAPWMKRSGKRPCGWRLSSTSGRWARFMITRVQRFSVLT